LKETQENVEKATNILKSEVIALEEVDKRLDAKLDRKILSC